MTTRFHFRLLAGAAILLSIPALSLPNARAQGSSLGSFSYQGRLNDTSGPANGLFDFQFSLHPASSGTNNQVDTTITRQFLPVSNGLFAVTLSFPMANSSFNGSDRWLEIAVKPGGVPTNYTLLSPRQQITSAPYAIRAANAGTVAGVNINSSLSSTALGLNTTASGPFSTAMGESTVAGGPHSTAMGRNTIASGGSSTAMGEFSQANGNFSTAMGYGTRASGTHSTAMGWGSEAAGNFSMASGYASMTAGERSFAAGTLAYATNEGSFVWADASAGTGTNAAFGSTGTNQFVIRATGGVGINTNNPNGAALAVNGDMTVSGNFKGGYSGNSVGAGTEGAVIAGGGASGSANSIGVNSDFSAIGGGEGNSIAANSLSATIAGGVGNDIGVRSWYSAIGGGGGNNIADDSWYATIAGGGGNDIGVRSYWSAIGGGRDNIISSNSSSASIAGGQANDIGVNAYSSAIGGGVANNIASNAQSAVIPGGLLNDVGAGASFAFAAGRRAKANHPGTFVWADFTEADFASTANNQFSIRASGGLRLSDSTSMEFGATLRQMLNLWGAQYGIGVQASSLYFRCNNASANDGFIWYKGGAHNDGYAQPGAGGTELMHLVSGGLYVNGALVPSSDRNKKENFKPVQPREVLEKVVALPLSSWNYKADPATRHVGPMAQDFHAAFGVGPDDKHIATVDADGVALAAIQGLNQKLEETRAENAALREQLTTIKTMLEKLTNAKD